MEEKIYPTLEPTAPADNTDVNSWRIQKILDIQNEFEKNKEERRKTLKKYTKAINVVSGSDAVLTAATIGVGATGVVLLSTVVAAPLVLVMEAVSIGTGILSIISKYINKKLQLKAEKHQRILVLTESKLNTVYSHISKALNDGTISEEEFNLILQEETKYKELKNSLKMKHEKKLSTHERETLLEQGEKEAVKKIKNLLKK